MSVMHLCNAGGCRAVIPLNERYCPKHQRATPVSRQATREEREQYEEREVQFYHSKQWKHLSKTWRYQHPNCAECERQGRITAGRLVDHIKPIKTAEGWKHRLDEDNLQTLCFACHAAKTSREVSARGGRTYHRQNPTK